MLHKTLLYPNTYDITFTYFPMLLFSILSQNLDAILDQVRWALAEDSFGGTLLTPRLRRLRFRGGAQEMTTGFNTDDLDSEFSVVSVR